MNNPPHTVSAEYALRALWGGLAAIILSMAFLLSACSPTGSGALGPVGVPEGEELASSPGVGANTTVSCLGFPDLSYCDRIWMAMSELALSSNEDCAATVSVLSLATIIFDETYMFGDGYIYYGWVPEIGGYPLEVHLANPAFEDPYFPFPQLMNTLAHEAGHLMGMHHPEADNFGDACAGVL